MDKDFDVLVVAKSVVEVVSDSFVDEAVGSKVVSELSVVTVVDDDVGVVDRDFDVLVVAKSVVEVVSDSFVDEAVDSNVVSELSVVTVVDSVDVAGINVRTVGEGFLICPLDNVIAFSRLGVCINVAREVAICESNILLSFDAEK